MQEPTEEAEDVEASISTENAREGPDENLNRTSTVRRKAAKGTLPWDLKAGELDLVSPQSQAEEIAAARKKPRLEEPLPTTTDEAARKTASPDVSVGLPPPAADNGHVDADAVTDTQSNACATRRWTSEEDAKLSSAVTNTSKKKWGKEYKTNWDAVDSLVPSRTKKDCYDRWRNALDPSIDRANRCTGKWTEDEDTKLKDSVQMHGGKDWAAISALIPGRTKIQCRNRWHDAFDPNIVRASGRKGKWRVVEDVKLKDSVQTHGENEWVAVAALVPGRTRKQCRSRWHDVLNPSIDSTMARAGKWTPDEVDTLKDAVQTHGGKNWAAIAALVPDRTDNQCRKRWHHGLDSSIKQAS
jgi:hypothetical protein